MSLYKNILEHRFPEWKAECNIIIQSLALIEANDAESKQFCEKIVSPEILREVRESIDGKSHSEALEVVGQMIKRELSEMGRLFINPFPAMFNAYKKIFGT